MENLENHQCYNCLSKKLKLRSHKLQVTNWMNNIPPSSVTPNIVEVQFKNNRKEFYQNVNKILLKPGDFIAVESSPGHDIGIVSLLGDLVLEQMQKYNNLNDEKSLKKIYRIAQEHDIKRWKEAIKSETPTLIKSRKIINDLGLNMKLSDVEYQGDKQKAYFYYIADERVDFRELIKILAEEFRVRVEMRQIGARQEAGLVGGVGVCGRKLCCSSWLSNFVSISTNTVREQELPMNPQKLAGQCSKLKCCLNYELDIYLDAKKEFPSTDIPLRTSKGEAYHQKTDIFQGILWYTYTDTPFKQIPLTINRVKKIIRLNRKGKKPKALTDKSIIKNNENYFVKQTGVNNINSALKKTKKSKNHKSQKKHNQ